MVDIRLRCRVFCIPAGAIALVLLASGCVGTPDLIVRPLPPQASARRAEASLADALQRAETNYAAALSGKSTEARALYAAAVSDAIDAMSLKESSLQWSAPVEAGQYQLHFGPGNRGRPLWRASRWNGIVPANKVTRVHSTTRVVGDGLGCPVILIMKGTDDAQRRYRAIPQNGIHLPATAVLVFGKPTQPGGQRPVELLLLNTRNSSVARIDGREVHLAIDLTAPLELQFRNRFILSLARSGLFRPEQQTTRAGLFGTEPYDPDKIPVIFVHGLNSAPHIWLNAMNAVIGDPVLRARYQIWYFIYPTGQPIMASSLRLREDLVGSRNYFDPKGTDPGINQAVLIGHSMGGIVARMQVIDSGEDFRKAYFTRPIDELTLSDENRALLRASLQFSRVPWIRRVVFAATPHLGSELADKGIVRFLLFLIRLPLTAAEIVAELTKFNAEAINPELHQFARLGVRSVQKLSPRHPHFRALNARPIEVPFHSIIGDRGRNDTPNSSDGVVPYWSSHLDGAQSEKIVAAPHSLTEHPETVKEIRRILREHLRGINSRSSRSTLHPLRTDNGPP
jgi:pimeloyl-ACP methyl ester carboxylesterase